jgi:hypothetical protein
MAPTQGCALRDELAELDASPERLLERYDHKRKINRFHSPIVRQLPPDVTSTIFEFCLTDFADHQLSPNAKEDLSIPLSLGAICSCWREIAWSTPTLWSSLVVRFSSEHDSHLLTSITQEWLTRSGQLPLSICIITRFSRDDQIPALIDIINQYSSRWSNLDLYMPDKYYRLLRATAPILKSIRFDCSSGVGMTLDCPLTCPRLERVDLTKFYVHKTNIQWDNLTHLTLLVTNATLTIIYTTIIQWDNLTHLSLLSSMTIVNSFLILRKAPRLVFCKISGSVFSPYEEAIGAPVLTLASLRSLHLITSFAKDILDNLIAPHLEELSLPIFYNPSMDISMEVITSFLGRSAVQGSLRVPKLDLYPAIRIPEDRTSYVSSLVEQGAIVNVLSRSDDIVRSTTSYHSNPEIWAIIVYQLT